MLVASIFSFSYNVFYSIKDINHHFSDIEVLLFGNGFKAREII